MTDQYPEAPAPTTDALTSIAQSIQSTTDILSGVIKQQEQRLRNENTWSTVKRTAMLTAIIGGSVGYATLYAPMAGYSAGPSETSVAVVDIEGSIGGMQPSNADVLAPAIRRTCGDSNVSGLVLRINSPGGSPSDAERIAAAVSECREGGKRVVAVIEGTGASAAYMIALEADAIWANRYGIVGSIGAVMRSIDGSDLADRVGLRERVYASGDQKAGGGFLSANTDKQDEAAQELVDTVGGMFREDVLSRRGDRLKETADMWSGRTWVSSEAKSLGLIDHVGVFETAYETEFGDVPEFEVSARPTLQDRLNLEDVTKRLAAHLVSELTTGRLE